MTKYSSNDETIAAISTPEGEGGIAVIRISGKLSLNIMKEIFKAKGIKNDNTFESHKLYLGFIRHPKTGETLDNVFCTIMKSPNSYTGEDTVEIHTHGGLLVPKRVLELTFNMGARPAFPGEFTQRAYINGKMDLVQAEAVADIIHAQTEKSLKIAEKQLEGALSDQINKLKDKILDILAEIEANVDFPEEEMDELVLERIINLAEEIVFELSDLVSTYDTGRIIKQGINTAILGKPNVGKSSILNQLLKQQRAIVSPLPGTTRDFIEETLDINGIPLKVVDTAGIRSTSDEIESVGVKLANKKAQEAELLILVFDGSSQLDNNDLEVLTTSRDKKSIIVINKLDLEQKTDMKEIKNKRKNSLIVKTSAKTGKGIGDLKEKIYGTLISNESKTEGSESIITELRHKLSLDKSIEHLNLFIEQIKKNESPEYLAIDLRTSLDFLGEITGEVTTEDVLGRIFSKFCIGK